MFYISLKKFLHSQNITVEAYVTIVCHDYIHCRQFATYWIYQDTTVTTHFVQGRGKVFYVGGAVGG